MAGKNRCVINQARDFQGVLAKARGKATTTRFPHDKHYYEGPAAPVVIKAEDGGLNAYFDGQLMGPIAKASVREWHDKIVANGGFIEVPAFLYYSNGWYAVAHVWDQDFLA